MRKWNTDTCTARIITIRFPVDRNPQDPKEFGWVKPCRILFCFIRNSYGDILDDEIRHTIQRAGLQAQVDRVVDVVHHQQAVQFSKRDLGGEQVEAADAFDPFCDLAQASQSMPVFQPGMERCVDVGFYVPET